MDNKCGGCGKQWPCPDTVQPGSSYDTGKGSCISLHAEQNAILYARVPLLGATAYGTHDPCDGCLRLIRGAQIRRVVTPVSELLFDLP